MRLQELLNKFTNADFLITVNGWCDKPVQRHRSGCPVCVDYMNLVDEIEQMSVERGVD